MAAPARVPADVAGVGAPRPYSPIGNIPTDAVRTHVGMHGNSAAVPYVSDRPYIPPSYNERTVCDGTRTNGEPCKAKAEPESSRCRSHQDKG